MVPTRKRTENWPSSAMHYGSVKHHAHNVHRQEAVNIMPQRTINQLSWTRIHNKQTSLSVCLTTLVRVPWCCTTSTIKF